MRNATATTIAISLFLFFSLVAAADAPKLSFGSMQSGERGSLLPGETQTFKIYFFVDSEYGNRITHITLNATDIPDGWNVTINPEIHQSVISVNGAEKTITESLYVEPKPILNESDIPDPKPDGIAYLNSPSGKGFLQAKMAEVTITVPADAKSGDSGRINIAGVAQWYGDQGVVLFTQARDFVYTISVASPEEFTEEIITPVVNVSQNATQNASSAQPESGSDNTVLFVVGGIVIIAVAYLFTRKK
ncbi:Uncharacterised protein [uncultured archaeon]|nr:Uncharacterised protein [uncultured archaeon]